MRQRFTTPLFLIVALTMSVLLYAAVNPKVQMGILKTTEARKHLLPPNIDIDKCLTSSDSYFETGIISKQVFFVWVTFIAILIITTFTIAIFKHKRSKYLDCAFSLVPLILTTILIVYHIHCIRLAEDVRNQEHFVCSNALQWIIPLVKITIAFSTGILSVCTVVACVIFVNCLLTKSNDDDKSKIWEELHFERELLPREPFLK